MIKIGIIGSNFGTIGLLPAFKNIKNCKVIVISSGKDWRKILENKDLDAIAIAVPPNIQYQISKVAIKKGLHVFAEKPLTVNIKQARELVNLAKKYKVITAVDFIFPEIIEWQKVKELLHKKILGNLKHIAVDWQWLSGDIKYGRSTWRTDLKEGGGVLSFYFSHGLYYLENFAGKIKNIKTKFTNSKESKNGAEVGIDMQIVFKNGLTGEAHVFCNNKNTIKHQLRFICEKGIIILENKNAIVNKFIIKIQNKNGTKILKIKSEKDKKNEDERVKEVRKIVSRFIQSCSTKKQMSPSFMDGLRAQELIQIARKNKV